MRDGPSKSHCISVSSLREVLDKLAGMMNYTFLGEKTVKFQSHENINESSWNQRIAAVERRPVFDDGDNEELEEDVRNYTM